MEMDIENDAFQLCVDVLKIGMPDCHIAMEANEGLEVDYTYSHPRTPAYLEDQKVLTINHKETEARLIEVYGYRWFISKDIGKETKKYSQPKGFYIVTFDLPRTKKWLNKTIKSNSIKQGLRPGTLTILSNGDFEYLDPSGKKKTPKFTKGTNEHRLIMHFINNPKIPFQVGELVPLLKDPRQKADSTDSKRRAKDIIAVIRTKLVKNVILTTHQGYIFNSIVVKL